MPEQNVLTSGIWDNHQRGLVGEYLRDRIKVDSDLSFVSAYFTIHAYEKLKDELDQINHLRFLFGEPSFIQTGSATAREPKKTFQTKYNAILLV